MKIDKQFALGSWEIHLQTSNERECIFNKMYDVCTYIDTALNYNNDYLLKGHDEYKLISKIAPCHYGEEDNDSLYEFFVSNHLKCLRRDKIDIMLIHSSRGNWKPLALRMANDDRFIETGVSNFSVEDLEEYKQLLGHYPTYNEFEINPFYTETDTIKFCKEKGIKIIAYGIFGGKYNAMTYIADYSIPYLVKYASEFADILILKPESERQANEIIDVVKNYDFDDGNEIKLNTVLDNKAVVPMRYFAKDIVKKHNGFETYMNGCGRNSSIGLKQVPLDIKFPKTFEMLGDYMTMIRYMYRKNYFDVVYDQDFLIGDDGNCYVVYLRDEKGRISKINETGIVETYRLEK